MRLAVDVMGGDHGCGVVIEGVKRALGTGLDISSVFLVGNERDVGAALKASGYSGYVAVELGMAYALDPEPVVAACLQWLQKAFDQA